MRCPVDQITAQFKPSTLKPRELLERGKLKSVRARVLSAHLESRVASCETTALKKHLGSDTNIAIKNITDSAGPGKAVLIGANWQELSELGIAYGEPGRTSETVVRNVVKDFTRYQNTTAPVGHRLADQLLLPFALAGGGSSLILSLTNHFETNQKVPEAFLPVTVYTTKETRSEVLVEIL